MLPTKHLCRFLIVSDIIFAFILKAEFSALKKILNKKLSTYLSPSVTLL